MYITRIGQEVLPVRPTSPVGTARSRYSRVESTVSTSFLSLLERLRPKYNDPLLFTLSCSEGVVSIDTDDILYYLCLYIYSRYNPDLSKNVALQFNEQLVLHRDIPESMDRITTLKYRVETSSSVAARFTLGPHSFDIPPDSVGSYICQYAFDGEISRRSGMVWMYTNMCVELHEFVTHVGDVGRELENAPVRQYYGGEIFPFSRSRKLARVPQSASAILVRSDTKPSSVPERISDDVISAYPTGD